MITFCVCLALLVAAYFTYGRFLERVAGIDPAAETPCRRLYDGVDYVPLPRWRTFLIQLLNIAGTGPIFGAVLGACFGPAAVVRITQGGIFTCTMHETCRAGCDNDIRMLVVRLRLGTVLGNGEPPGGLSARRCGDGGDNGNDDTQTQKKCKNRRLTLLKIRHSK